MGARQSTEQVVRTPPCRVLAAEKRVKLLRVLHGLEKALIRADWYNRDHRPCHRGRRATAAPDVQSLSDGRPPNDADDKGSTNDHNKESIYAHEATEEDVDDVYVSRLFAPFTVLSFANDGLANDVLTAPPADIATVLHNTKSYVPRHNGTDDTHAHASGPMVYPISGSSSSSSSSSNGSTNTTVEPEPADANTPSRPLVDCLRVLRTLSCHRHLTALDLSYNALTAGAVVALVGAVGALPRLRSLRLTGNPIGFDGCAALRDWLARDPAALQELVLAHCMLSECDVLTLLSGLRSNAHLRVLHMAYNDCTEKVLEATLDLVQQANTTLAAVMLESAVYDANTLLPVREAGVEEDGYANEGVEKRWTLPMMGYACTAQGVFRSGRTHCPNAEDSKEDVHREEQLVKNTESGRYERDQRHRVEQDETRVRAPRAARVWARKPAPPTRNIRSRECEVDAESHSVVRAAEVRLQQRRRLLRVDLAGRPVLPPHGVRQLERVLHARRIAYVAERHADTGASEAAAPAQDTRIDEQDAFGAVAHGSETHAAPHVVHQNDTGTLATDSPDLPVCTPAASDAVAARATQCIAWTTSSMRSNDTCITPIAVTHTDRKRPHTSSFCFDSPSSSSSFSHTPGARRVRHVPTTITSRTREARSHASSRPMSAADVCRAHSGLCALTELRNGFDVMHHVPAEHHSAGSSSMRTQSTGAGQTALVKAVPRDTLDTAARIGIRRVQMNAALTGAAAQGSEPAAQAPSAAVYTSSSSSSTSDYVMCTGNPSRLRPCWCEPDDHTHRYAGTLHYHCIHEPVELLRGAIEQAHTHTPLPTRQKQTRETGRHACKHKHTRNHKDKGKPPCAMLRDAWRGIHPRVIRVDLSEKAMNLEGVEAMYVSTTPASSVPMTAENRAAVHREPGDAIIDLGLSESAAASAAADEKGHTSEAVNGSTRPPMPARRCGAHGAGAEWRYRGCVGTCHRCCSMPAEGVRAVQHMPVHGMAARRPYLDEGERMHFTNGQGVSMRIHYNPKHYFSLPYRGCVKEDGDGG